MLGSGENWLEDLDPECLREVQQDLATADSLKSICKELHELIVRLVEERDAVKAFAVMVIVTRVLRLTLVRKRPQIASIVQELKERTDIRPILGKRYAADNQ